MGTAGNKIAIPNDTMLLPGGQESSSLLLHAPKSFRRRLNRPDLLCMKASAIRGTENGQEDAGWVVYH